MYAFLLLFAVIFFVDGDTVFLNPFPLGLFYLLPYLPVRFLIIWPRVQAGVLLMTQFPSFVTKIHDFNHGVFFLLSLPSTSSDEDSRTSLLLLVSFNFIV